MQITLESSDIADIVDVAIENAFAPIRLENRRLWKVIGELQSSFEEQKKLNLVEINNLSSTIKDIKIPEQKDYDSIVDHLTLSVSEIRNNNDKLLEYASLQELQSVRDQTECSLSKLREEIVEAKEVRVIPGRDGVDGKDGKDGIDGVDGKDGLPGIDGKDGIDGTSGKDGKDGIGLASAMIDRNGNLLITMTNGSTIPLGAVVGRDGVDGTNGVDGINGINGNDGTDGADGESTTVDDIMPTIMAHVEQVLSSLPIPKDGVDGKNGIDGVDGIDGKSISIEEVVSSVMPEIERIISALPPPKDGVDGIDGKDGIGLPGADGKDGNPGRDGIDGKDVDYTHILTIIDDKFTAEKSSIVDIVEERINNIFKDLPELVEKKINEIPVFRDGTDINTEQIMSDLTVRVKNLLAVERDTMQRSLEEMIPTAIKGDPGEPGVGISLDDITPFILERIDQLISDAISSIPKPKDGDSVTIEDITPIILDHIDNISIIHYEKINDNIEALVAKKVDNIILPAPKEIDVNAIKEMVAEAVSSIPKPLDGYTPTSDDLIPLIDSIVDSKVKLLPIPKDGISIVESIIDQSGCLIQTMSDGTIKNAGVVVVRNSSEISKPDSKNDENIPEEIAAKVARATSILAESSNIQQPPMVLNINTPSSTTTDRSKSKRIITRRDNDGNLISEVTET